jgi:hypothetical protein
MRFYLNAPKSFVLQDGDVRRDRDRGQSLFVEIENAEILHRDIIHLILTAGRAGLA